MSCQGGREQGGELAPRVSSLCSQAWKTHLSETVCLTCLSWGFQGQPDTPPSPCHLLPSGTGSGLPTCLPWRALVGTMGLPSWGPFGFRALCVSVNPETGLQGCRVRHPWPNPNPHAHLTK